MERKSFWKWRDSVEPCPPVLGSKGIEEGVGMAKVEKWCDGVVALNIKNP
jgi:hypothetical protein